MRELEKERVEARRRREDVEDGKRREEVEDDVCVEKRRQRAVAATCWLYR